MPPPMDFRLPPLKTPRIPHAVFGPRRHVSFRREMVFCAAEIERNPRMGDRAIEYRTHDDHSARNADNAL
jgi:hypothetical protein